MQEVIEGLCLGLCQDPTQVSQNPIPTFMLLSPPWPSLSVQPHLGSTASAHQECLPHSPSNFHRYSGKLFQVSDIYNMVGRIVGRGGQEMGRSSVRGIRQIGEGWIKGVGKND